jgi:hypothetical protein
MQSSENDRDSKWILLNQSRLELQALRIFREMHELGFQPVLIKGWAAARNYPPDRARFYSDIDIAVSADDFTRVEQIMQTAGSGLSGIDLHNELRHLDSQPWTELFERSSLVEIEGGKLRILSAEDHLRVMATHWLTDGGANKDRLWDIYYAVANRPADFDWARCLDPVSETRRTWVVCAVGLAHEYLGLPIDDLPFREAAKNIPGWVIRTVEKEWAASESMLPLQRCLGDRKLFIRQLRRRFPPNPIQATIQMEAPIDETGRTSIQLRNAFHRAKPSISRIFEVLRQRK